MLGNESSSIVLTTRLVRGLILIPLLSGAQTRRSGSSKLDGLRRAPARQLVRDVLGKARNRLESGSPYVI